MSSDPPPPYPGGPSAPLIEEKNGQPGNELQICSIVVTVNMKSQTQREFSAEFTQKTCSEFAASEMSEQKEQKTKKTSWRAKKK